MPRSSAANNLIALPSAAPSQLMSDFQWFGDTLRARNSSPSTVESYRLTLATLDRFLADRGYPRSTAEITRPMLQAFMTDQLGKHSAGTANTRYAGLRAFFNFAVNEEIIEKTPMRGMSAPTKPTEPVPVLSIEDLRALLDACTGKSFADRRDTAILRLLLDTGMRRAELMGLHVDDLLLDQHLVQVRHENAKGKKARVVPFGAKTAQALQRYLRLRRTHKYAASPFLWVSQMGAQMEPPALNNLLVERTRAAGLPHVHPHQFRHTAAHLNLKGGMQENALMRLMGWSSPEMLQRYGASAADERARAAYFAQGAPGDLV
jgi:site-specific recombinase XerD